MQKVVHKFPSLACSVLASSHMACHAMTLFMHFVHHPLYNSISLFVSFLDFSWLCNWSCSGLQTECTSERTRTVKAGVTDIKKFMTILLHVYSYYNK